LQIQVLDDSTDESQAIAKAAVADWAAKGYDIVYLHRTNREGYKAGALEEGLKSATGDYVAIFDADFVPPVDILHNVVHYFTDERSAWCRSAGTTLTATRRCLPRRRRSSSTGTS
jgi:cellulose synthase/poly-beta-1,6-N-acetylglucosamine synthase-like glycosyltransferase